MAGNLLSDNVAPVAPDKVHKYKVGYRCPPLHSRFKPGQSGNPKGRKPGLGKVRQAVKSGDVHITIILPSTKKGLRRFRKLLLELL